MTTIKTITAAFALTASLITPTMAADAATPSSAKVTYADLNLSTEQGRAVFDMRIKRAIEGVCGRTTGKIGMDKAVKECRRDTMAAAKQSRD
ncbi:MAG: UrcA family protein, partial [Pseudomonadota bacterium]